VYTSDTPHTIQNLIWYQDNGLSDTERVRLMFGVYRDIPCYALVMAFGYDRRSSDAISVFWHEVRHILSHPDEALAAPLTYMLWCDFFEAPDRCAVAWQSLYDSQSNDYLLTRLLDCAGPVPYAWKAELYQQKLPDQSWHMRIYENIRASYYDVYRDIDKDHAGTLLAQLHIAETTDIQKLRVTLGSGDRYTNHYHDRQHTQRHRRRR
jgi:hypothetical protein